jgi:hypothetical protein
MSLSDQINARAQVRVRHERPYDYDEKRGLWLYRRVDDDVTASNILTDAGRVWLHTLCYGAAGSTNGLNYIALSNDTAAPAAVDTVLAGELTGNGLDRAQGTVELPVSPNNQTAVSYTFTYSGGVNQTVRKTALFDTFGPPPAGNMAHEIAFTPRILVPSDAITIVFTITLG